MGFLGMGCVVVGSVEWRVVGMDFCGVVVVGW